MHFLLGFFFQGVIQSLGLQEYRKKLAEEKAQAAKAVAEAEKVATSKADK